MVCNTARLKQAYRLKEDLHNMNGSISSWYGATKVIVGDVPADGMRVWFGNCLRIVHNKSEVSLHCFRTFSCQAVLIEQKCIVGSTSKHKG